MHMVLNGRAFNRATGMRLPHPSHRPYVPCFSLVRARSIWSSSRDSSSASWEATSSLPLSKARSALSPVASSFWELLSARKSPPSRFRSSSRRATRDLCSRSKASRRAMAHHLSKGQPPCCRVLLTAGGFALRPNRGLLHTFTSNIGATGHQKQHPPAQNLQNSFPPALFAGVRRPPKGRPVHRSVKTAGVARG